MLKIYNTLTKKKEEFKPLRNNTVTFYHCGPTVYWTQHIGNLRAVVLNDLIVRTLEYLGYDVTLVRNYTDVGHLTSDEDAGEDKLEKGAKREGLSPQEVANKYIKIFESDITELNVRMPNIKARATKHIQEMQTMIQILLDKDFAYQTKLAIYFDVSKAKNYTKLSGQNLEKNRAGAGEGEANDPKKKQSADFALWFFKTGKHKNALQTWQSPWGSLTDKADGQGFPGWHIECSAMAKKYLGDTIDIHMGGIEHIPVHHTNEIAQSENANSVKFVNYWLHNEHLTVDGAKMAKSAGTAYSLSEIKQKRIEPLALRYFFLGAHYRSKQNFTWEALTAAQTALHKLRAEILEIKKTFSNSCEEKSNEKYRERFVSVISDDFNAPQALAILWEIIKDDSLINAEKYATIIDFDKIFCLKLNELTHAKTHISPEIQALVDNRNKFRELGDFEQADAVRQEIELQGYLLEDTPTGPLVKKK